MLLNTAVRNWHLVRILFCWVNGRTAKGSLADSCREVKETGKERVAVSHNWQNYVVRHNRVLMTNVSFHFVWQGEQAQMLNFFWIHCDVTTWRFGCNCHWLVQVPHSWQVLQNESMRRKPKPHIIIIIIIHSNTVGRDTVVSAATGYRLEDPEIESLRGLVSVPVQTDAGAQQWALGHFRG